jgi:hypothetical protein
MNVSLSALFERASAATHEKRYFSFFYLFCGAGNLLAAQSLLPRRLELKAATIIFSV